MAHCTCNILLKDQVHYCLHVVYPREARPLCVGMCCEIAVIHETALWVLELVMRELCRPAMAEQTHVGTLCETEF